jgi:hypothetical protein
MQTHLFGNTINGAPDRSGNVSPVTVTIVCPIPVTDEICTSRNAASEFVVRCANSRIQNVNMNSGSGLVVHIGRIQREIPLIDAIETPRGAGLRGVCTDDAVLFHPFHA